MRTRPFLRFAPYVLALAAAFVIPARAIELAHPPDPPSDRPGPASLALADGVAETVGAPLAEADLGTGAALFDGEWFFGTYMMAAMGFGQLAASDAERRAKHLADMERALDRMLAADARAFDLAKWRGDDPLADHVRGDHAAYLGYGNLALSLHRSLVPDSRFAAVNDRLSAHLEAALEREGEGLLETYPGECYPVDNAGAQASIALRRRALGLPESPATPRFAALVRERLLDRGLLVQSASRDVGWKSAGRGSGTMLASYFLAYSDEALSRALYDAAVRELYGEPLGFGAFREYARGDEGRGDIDSGPLILGFSISASGFGLGASRAHGDAATFRALHRTSALFGAPGDGPLGRHHATGGPIGDAILFAMMTAPRANAGPRTAGAVSVRRAS